MTNVVIYARSGTRAQKRDHTAETQIAACRTMLGARGGSLLGVFRDDGVSGTVPLRERSSGRRMLQLLESGAVDALLVFRLDRLSRRFTQVVDELEKACRGSLEIWSVSKALVSDPRDSAPVVAHALRFGPMELEGSDRIGDGRDQVAAMGQWIGCPLPFGYDLDDAGGLTPSLRAVAGVTEAELARSVFVAMANGSTSVAEAHRLQALGAAPGTRYSRRVALANPSRWRPARIDEMIRDPLYAGACEISTRLGTITRQVPALVDRSTWDAAQTPLAITSALRRARSDRVN